VHRVRLVVRVIAHLCDARLQTTARCPERAYYRVDYDPMQKPVEVCYDHLAWPADLCVASGGDMHVSLIGKRRET
jgi:hypothetical protein